MMDFNNHLIPEPTPTGQLGKEKVVIIIPTYNEMFVIKNTIMQVFAAVEAIEDFDVHILIFDSNSTDKTQDIVSSLQDDYPKLHLKREQEKSGLGSAYLQAMRYALTVMNADIVFEFDADLSHQPKYIKPMLEKIKDFDVVVGSRYVPGGSIPKNWEWHRKVFSVLGNYVARTVLTPKYKDFTSGFRATRRRSLINVLPQRFLSNHYAYKLQLLWLLHKSKAKICEYPIEFIDREDGESKLPKNSIIDALHVVFTLRYYELKRYLKMCLVGLMGMTVQFVAYNLFRKYLPAFNASQLAVLAAIIHNFILNRNFTFKSSLKLSKFFEMKRLLWFGLYSVVMIYLQSYWLKFGITYLGSGFLQENLIIGVGIGLASLLNYFAYSRHVWPEPKVLNRDVLDDSKTTAT
ncbi:glycosyltransferase [Legionella donaldsonii]|uniref:Glycosyltransferase n=2 Tax=Legionella donaldsonii TaxID=45060 RepID=A0A378IZK9_9GAMM|nr:glycosyltransferase family 2 protein [Legionella donaldsonii]STX40903.1 glycosyltransferase [Legionella donaldsonii]